MIEDIAYAANRCNRVRLAFGIADGADFVASNIRFHDHTILKKKRQDLVFFQQ